jgi:hypothetical protein
MAANTCPIRLSRTRRLSVWNQLPKSINSYNLDWKQVTIESDYIVFIGYDKTTGIKKFKAVKKENYIINKICASEDCYSVANGVMCRKCEKKE